jgi:hypothetical protein
MGARRAIPIEVVPRFTTDYVRRSRPQSKSGNKEKGAMMDNVDVISQLRQHRQYRCGTYPHAGGAVPTYPCNRQIEGATPAALARSRPGASQVTRLRELAAVSKLDPDFAEAFLAFVVREVIRQHEAVPRGFFEDTSPQ